MQIASQHLHVPPPSPRLLRPDLPIAAERVILRAMAKRPEDRYARGQDLATAFRNALTTVGTRRSESDVEQRNLGSFWEPLKSHARGAHTNSFAPSVGAPSEAVYQSFAPSSPAMAPVAHNTITSSSEQQAMGTFRARQLLDPAWQAAPSDAEPSTDKSTGALPPAHTSPIRSSGLLSAYKTGILPQAKGTLPTAPAYQSLAPTRFISPAPDASTSTLSTTSTAQPAVGARFIAPARRSAPMPAPSPTPETTTEALALPKHRRSSANKKMNSVGVGAGLAPALPKMKLTGPVKVVQVPIAGQPGRYITGLLPVSPQEDTHQERRQPRPTLKIIALVVTLLLVIGTASFWFAPTYLSRIAKIPQAGNATSVTTTNPPTNATATTGGDSILSDPLSQNIHNWPTSPTTTASYTFTGGAYHITNLGDRGTAVVLQATSFDGPIAYTLTIQEIKGNDTSLNNSFGMILRSNVQNKGGKLTSSFYSFEVVNTPGGEYRFYKYDDSQASSGSAWTEIWHQPFDSAFHQGHNPNTIKIFASGNKFTFTVNGKTIGHTQDSSIASGGVGMLVNLKGTEIAFSNLLITHS